MQQKNSVTKRFLAIIFSLCIILTGGVVAFGEPGEIYEDITTTTATTTTTQPMDGESTSKSEEKETTTVITKEEAEKNLADQMAELKLI